MNYASERRWDVHIYRAVVVVLAGFDLFFRAIDSLPWRLVPLELAKPSISLLGWYLARFSSWGDLLEWLVLAAILFTFLPVVYRPVVGVAADGYGFRLICTVFTLMVTSTIYNSIGFQKSFSIILLIFFVGGIFTCGYLRYFTQWRLFKPDGQAMTFLNGFHPEYNERKTLKNHINQYQGNKQLVMILLVTEFGMLLAFQFLVGGFLMIFLKGISPIADVMLIGWFVYAIWSKGFKVRSLKPFDVEKQSFRTVANATRSWKGFFIVLISILGLTFGIIPLALLVGILTSISSISAFDPLKAWNFLGVMLLLLSGSLSFSWVWFRELNRISVFLDRWDGKDSVFGGPNRPIASTLPGTAAICCVVAFAVSVEHISISRWLFAMIWPVIFAILGFSYWRTDKRRMRFTKHEDLAIATGLSVQLTGFQFYFAPDRLFSILTLEGWRFLVRPEGIFIFLAPPFVLLLPNLGRYFTSMDDEDPRRYLIVVFFLSMAVIFQTISYASENPSQSYNIITGISAISALVFAIWIFLERY